MKKLFILLLIVIGAGYVYVRFFGGSLPFSLPFASSPAYDAYEKFATAVTQRKFNDARNLAAGPLARSQVDEAERLFSFMTSQNMHPNIHGVSYTKQSESSSDGGKKVILKVTQVVKLDPPGQTSAFGTPVAHEHNVTMVLLNSKWLVESFEDRIPGDDSHSSSAKSSPPPPSASRSSASSPPSAKSQGMESIENQLKEYAQSPPASAANARGTSKTKVQADSTDADGWTPLMRAAWKGDVNGVRDLLNQGANIEAKDPAGWTSLLLAAFQGNAAVVEFLIAKGADVNAKTGKNTSALIAAAGKGRADVVRILLAKGADVNIRDADGKTALNYATEKGHAAVADSLRKAGAKN